MVNRATWRVAAPVHATLRRLYPLPASLAAASPDDIRPILRPLRFVTRRAERLVAFARAWVEGPPVTADDVLGMPGCGRYAADSFAIFVEGKTYISPTDRRLVEHLSHLMESDQCQA